MLNSIKRFSIICMLIFLLTACGASAEPTADVNMIMTQAVGTMVASYFGTQTALYTPPSPTSTITQTPYPTPTLFPTPTSLSAPTRANYVYFSPVPVTASNLTPVGTNVFVTATVDPLRLGSGCYNLTFIRDVTVPAGTVLKPREDFVKTWKVQNTGTCPWMYQFYIVSISGVDLDPGVTKIQKRVDPGSWSELSINVTSPKTPGTYTSYWRLGDANGVLFGATLVLSFEVAP